MENQEITKAKQLEIEKELLSEFEGNSNKIKINPLGSCQYNTIWETYILCKCLIKSHGLEHLEKLFGITYSKVYTKEEFEKNLFNTLNQCTYEDYVTNEEYDSFGHWLNATYLNNLEILEILEKQSMTIDQYIQLTKDLSYDLWSAYPSCLSDLKIEKPIDTPVFGPLLNRLVQGGNFTIGVELAYLNHYLGIDAELFEGYDT